MPARLPVPHMHQRARAMPLSHATPCPPVAARYALRSYQLWLFRPRTVPIVSWDGMGCRWLLLITINGTTSAERAKLQHLSAASSSGTECHYQAGMVSRPDQKLAQDTKQTTDDARPLIRTVSCNVQRSFLRSGLIAHTNAQKTVRKKLSNAVSTRIEFASCVASQDARRKKRVWSRCMRCQ